MTSQPYGPSLRIGHAERDRAVEVLREAAGEGRLTLDELDGRIETALQARTQADLREVLLDLVPAGAIGIVLAGGALSSAERLAQGMSWDDPLVITATWEDTKRLGPWEIPPFLEVNPVASNVRLYCVEAKPLAPVIDLVVAGGAGNLVLVLPFGWAANVDRVKKGMGTVKSTVPATPGPGSPLFVVRGSAGIGAVKVRHPVGIDRVVMNRDRRKRGLSPLRPRQLGA